MTRSTFSSATFHTVTYTAGKAPAALFIPDPAKGTYTGINDAAGAPFYFNGLPKLIYNPAAFGPCGGKTITTGVPASSGVLSPAGPKAPPAKATYTFPKAGVFQLICNVHPGMTDRRHREAGRHARAAHARPGDREGARRTSRPRGRRRSRWLQQPVPANTVYAGVGGTTAILSFFPQVLTVKAGTTVTS